MKNAWSLALAAAIAACGGGDPPPGESAASDTSAAEAPENWVTLVRQEHAGRSATPEPFRATASELRVITTGGPTSSPYLPGLVVANILAGEASLPVASVRTEGFPPDSIRSDTTLVEAGPGALYLFVPIHTGLDDWTVVVQERRPPG